MRHPQGIPFILENGRQNEAKLVDERMTIAGDSYYWYQVDENLSRLKYLVIHHSVTADTATPNDLARMHMNSNGWDGIGYHFVITKDGVIHYVGDLGTWRANVGGMNDKVIGVNLIGDFRFGKVPTEAQYKAANVLYREFVADGRFPGIKGPSALKFHRELNATQCPGDVDKNKILNYTAPYKVEPAQPPKVVPTPPVVPKEPVKTPPVVVLPPKEEEKYVAPPKEVLKEQQDHASFIANLLKPIMAFILEVIGKMKK